jgi:glycosyltransferase involved in cell wall biosynthesis
MALPEVSVVVATRNRAERLMGLINSLEAQSLDPSHFELVVVDDGSTDGTAERLAAASSRCSFAITVRPSTGAGIAVARNRGWRAARSSLVAFTDDDCEVAPTWLETLVIAARDGEGDVIYGPTLPIPRELASIGPFTHTKRIEGPNPSFQTCNIAYPRALLERLGGFDEVLHDLGEDTDLAWRAKEAGARFAWNPDARVFHAVDDVGPTGFLRRAARGADSVMVFRRHPELRAELRWGVFRNGRLPWLALALVGGAATRRTRGLAALLALPYALRLTAVCHDQRAPLPLAPFYAIADILHAITALRGSLRHRTLVL